MISIFKHPSDGTNKTANENPIECARAIGLLTVCLKAEMSFSESVIIVWRYSKGAIRGLFERSIRSASLGRAASLEESIEKDAKNMPKRIEWVSQPIIEFLRCLEETDSDQRQRMLERAHEYALGSCRQAISETISGLRVPFSTIFALGIVLPIIIATILPLWGMISTENVGIDGPYYEDLNFGLQSNSLSGVMIAGSMAILAFPIICMYSSKRFIKNRDMISNASLERLANKLLIYFFLIGAISIIVSFFADSSIVFWAFICILFLFSFFSNRLFRLIKPNEISDDLIQSPSILNSICVLLLQGEHFIRAISNSIKKSATCRELFWNSVLMDADRKNSSQRSNHGLRLIEEASNRDPKISARVFRQLSSHLLDLEKMEKDMRNELRPISQSAIVATMVLCPFVLGTVGGFNSIGILSDSEVHSFSAFNIIFASFIFEMVLNGYWMISCLSPDGKGLPKSLTEPRKMTFLSLAIFLVSFQASLAIFT